MKIHKLSRPWEDRIIRKILIVFLASIGHWISKKFFDTPNWFSLIRTKKLNFSPIDNNKGFVQNLNNTLKDSLLVCTKMVIIDPDDKISDEGNFRFMLSSGKTKLSQVVRAHVGSSLANSTVPLAKYTPAKDTVDNDPVEAFVICVNRKFAVRNEDFKFPEVSSIYVITWTTTKSYFCFWKIWKKGGQTPNFEIFWKIWIQFY